MDENNATETTEETAVDQPVVDTTAEVASASPAVPEASEAVKEAPSLLDAISAGIDEGAKPRRVETKAEELATDDSRPRNADGTFKAETPEEKAAREKADAEAVARKAETPEQKTEREKKEAEAAAKKPDDVNDPIPDGTNPRTAERIKSLIGTVKELQEQGQAHQQMFDHVRSTGASPEEFSSMLGYMRGVRSNDPKVWEVAYGVLQAEMKALSIKMGRPVPEVNLLRDQANADLVTEIQEGKLTPQRAHEIALHRETQKHQIQVRQQQTTSQTAETQKQAAVQEWNALQHELVTRDGQVTFDAKADILESFVTQSTPTQWKAAYDKLKLPAVAAPAPVVEAAPKTMPQRPKSPSGTGGGARPEPKTALDAISQALDGV